VISQVTFSLLLLIGAGLMIKSLITVIKSKPGFDAGRMLTIAVSLSPKHYQGEKVLTYLEEAERRIRRLPGVESFSYANGIPFAGANEAIFWLEDRPRPDHGKEPRVVQYLVGPNYFETLKIPLLKGRYFSSSDVKGQTPKVIIDESLAKKHFPDRDPLGKFLILSTDFPAFEIVGVVGHVKHYGLDVPARVEPEFYFLVQQIPEQFLSMVAQDLHLLIRTSNNPESVADSVCNELKAIDPEQPIMAPVTMQKMVDDSLAARRFTMILLSIFAVVALFLAAAGIYGVLSYAVVQRSKEIGIRMAVGAKKEDVFKLMLGGGFRLICFGLILGILCSLALSKLLASQLYGVSATDPATFVLVSLLLCSVGLAATYVPAARAMKVDPLSVLKYE
jgi:putative ABC transport system permease protein